jgi:hypothetical protein
MGVKTADVVVKGGGGADQKSVDIRVGQTLDIQLVDSYRWSLATSGQTRALVGLPSNGWHDAAQSLCVWQFSASVAGQETLSFTGAPICTPGVACPQFVLLLRYPVDVSA